MCWRRVGAVVFVSDVNFSEFADLFLIETSGLLPNDLFVDSCGSWHC